MDLIQVLVLVVGIPVFVFLLWCFWASRKKPPREYRRVNDGLHCSSVEQGRGRASRLPLSVSTGLWGFFK